VWIDKQRYEDFILGWGRIYVHMQRSVAHGTDTMSVRYIWDTTLVNIEMIQETQLSLSNRATHLCNMQWHG